MTKEALWLQKPGEEPELYSSEHAHMEYRWLARPGDIVMLETANGLESRTLVKRQPLTTAGKVGAGLRSIVNKTEDAYRYCDSIIVEDEIRNAVDAFILCYTRLHRQEEPKQEKPRTWRKPFTRHRYIDQIVHPELYEPAA